MPTAISVRIEIALAVLAQRIAALAPRLAAIRRPEDVTVGDVAALAHALGFRLAVDGR